MSNHNDLFDRYETPIDPDWLEYSGGYFADKLYHEDEYFEEERDHPKGLRLDRMVNTLPKKEKDCLELYVYGRMTYHEVAEHHDWILSSGRVDRKKAWRYVQQGLEKVRRMIEEDEEAQGDRPLY